MSKRAKARHVARRAERVDTRIGKAIAGLRDRPLVRQVCAIGELADQPQLFALSAGTVAAGLVLRRPRLVRTGLRMVASHALATFAKGWIKHRVDRRRPHVEPGDHRMKPGRVVDEGAHNSFPSGHSAGAVAVARAVARDYPRLAGPAAAASTFAAMAQMSAARHFPFDVAIGTAIGLAAEAIVTGITGTGGQPSLRAGHVEAPSS